MSMPIQAVFLDEATLEPSDLDFSRLLDPALPGSTEVKWARYPYTSPDQVEERVSKAQVVISNKVLLDGALLAAAPNLKLVLIAATGLNNIDLEAASEHGIAVCNAQNYGSASVAQHTVSLILALAGNLLAYGDAVRDGRWCESPQFCLLDFPVADLSGKTLGLVGYGAIAQAVERLALAFGMRIMVCESFRKSRKANTQTQDTHGGVVTRLARYPWREVLQSADVLSLHCALTPHTRHLIDAEALALMKPNALLINTARGPLIDSVALADALRSGRIAGAGLDVLGVEPPPSDDPLLTLQAQSQNLIITPHMAWASREARQTLLDQMAESFQAWLEGKPLPRRVV